MYILSSVMVKLLSPALPASVLLFLCLQQHAAAASSSSSSAASAAPSEIIILPHSTLPPWANANANAAAAAGAHRSFRYSSVSGTRRHHPQNHTPLSISNRINASINIRGGAFDTDFAASGDEIEEKVDDPNAYYSSESKYAPTSDDYGDGNDDDLCAVDGNGDADADATDQTQHSNESIEDSSSATTYDIVHEEMSLQIEEDDDGDTTTVLEEEYRTNDSNADGGTDILTTVDAMTPHTDSTHYHTSDQEVTLGLDKGGTVHDDDDNGQRQRQSFSEESEGFSVVEHNRYDAGKDHDTDRNEIFNEFVEMEDGEGRGEEMGEAHHYSASGVTDGHDDDRPTAATTSVHHQEISEDLASDERRNDSFGESNVDLVLSEEDDNNNDEGDAGSQEQVIRIDLNDEIRNERDAAEDEVEGIALVSAVETEDDDEDYPSGSDSTAFVDRMDLADAYDDEDQLVGVDNDDGTIDEIEHDIGFSPPVPSEDRKMESTSLYSTTTAPPPTPPMHPSKTSNTVQYMITQNMRRVLIRQLGYTTQEVNYMKPDVAAVVVNKMLRRPETGMPPQFYTEEGRRVMTAAAKRNQLKLLREVICRVWRKVRLPLVVAVGVVVLGGKGKVLLGLDGKLSASGDKKRGRVTSPPLTKIEEDIVEVEEGEDSTMFEGVILTPGVPERDLTYYQNLKPRGKYGKNLDRTWLDRVITSTLETVDDIFKRPF